jgi:membrane protease YdiL (CAAX protease family)
MLDVAKLYKADLRRQVMMCAIAIAVFYVANITVASVMTLAYTLVNGTRVIHGGSYDAEVQLVWLESIIGICVGATAFLMLRGKRLVTTDITHVNERIKIGDLLMAAVLMFGIQGVSAIIRIVLELFFSFMGGSTLDDYSNSMSGLLTLPGILYVVVIGPFVEEVMFRGGVMRSLERYGVNFSIVVSSLLFGAYHIYFTQAIFAFMLGLLLAYVAQRFSLKWALLLHVTNNGFAVCLSLVSELGETAEIVSALAVLAVFGLSLIGTVVILALRHKTTKVELGVRRPASMMYVLGLPQHVMPPAPMGWPQQRNPPTYGQPMGYQQPAYIQPMGYQQPACGQPPPSACGIPPMPPPSQPRYVQQPTQPLAQPVYVQQPTQPVYVQQPAQPPTQPQYAPPQPPAYQQPQFAQTQPQPTAYYSPQAQPAYGVPGYAPQMGYQQQYAPTVAWVYPQVDLRQTGLMPPPPLPYEPRPRPFQIAFSSPFLIALLAVLAALGLIITLL